MKILTAFFLTMSLFTIDLAHASGEPLSLKSVLVERDVDGNPFVTVLASTSQCEYPHYCNNKGTLYALRSHDEKIEEQIMMAMHDSSKKNVKGTKGGWIGQDYGWQIYDLWVDEMR
jgi:hypothetical protein